MIDGKVSPASVYAADGGDAGADVGSASADAEHHAPASDGGAEFTVDFGDNDQRQLTVEAIVAAYNEGTVTAETYLWAEGFSDWKPLGEVAEVVAALHAAAGAPAAAPAAAAAPVAAPAAAETPWQAPAAAAAPKAAAAAAAAPKGRDLFGGYERAGSEDDASSAAAGPAASPFGGGGGGAATGARNESSVLFSLSALTSAGGSGSRPSTPAPSNTSTSEDSGLIDLRALTASAAEAPVAAPMAAPMGLGSPSPLGMAPLGASPLGAPSPYGGMGMGVAPAMDLSIPQQQQKSKTGLFIAGGIVVAAVAVTLILQLTGNKEAPAPVIATTAATTSEVPATPAPTAAAPTAAPTTDAKPPATGMAADDAAPTTTAKAGGTTSKKPSTSSKKPSGSTSSAPAAAPAAEKPAAPKPAANKCGCKAGDLGCAMRCAAGG